MFTQCPNCQTTFKVTAEQLKSANGDVRCGQCLAIFSALDNLSEVAPVPIKNDKEHAANEINPSADIPGASIDQNLEEFFGDLFEDAPDEKFDEPLPYADPKTLKKNPAKTGDGFFYGANEATIEKILDAKDLDSTESVEDENEDLTKDVAISTEADSGIEDNAELNPVSETFDSEINKPKTKSSKTSVTEDQPEATNLTNVPDVILDELQAAKEKQLKPPTTQWAVGSIVFMLVLVLQVVYFSRDTLARNPTYRPLLTSACEVLKCEINIKFDPRLIEIIGRDVRSHPSSKKALIAGTTLINNASYAQPYPLLTLTFSDITGTKMAHRRFTPREYLRSGTDIEAGMPSEVPVQVELHLVDPGKAAVNFEFRAEVDPRT